MEKTHDPDVDIRVAEREVQSAKARLGAELEAAKKTGRRAIANLTHRARPLVIGVAVVGGLVVVAGMIRLMRGAFARPKRALWALPEQRRSVPRQLFNSAITSAAGAIASAAARKTVEKLKSPDAITPHESTVHFS